MRPTRATLGVAVAGAAVAAMMLASAARAQTPAQQAAGKPSQASTPKSAVVRGHVVAADTARPLRRARVMLAPAQAARGGATPVSAYTNAAGRFEFRDVSPGSYSLTAVRAGYITLQHGQRRPRESGVTVEVRAGETVERIDFALPRGGVLAGTITDEQGEPYPGVEVDALQLRYLRGRRVPFPVGGTTTDDQGGFRIPGLEPGSYYRVASSPETWRTAKGETYGYSSTYFPGGPIERAQRVQLATSEVKTGLHVSLQAGRTARVAGRVTRETGEPVSAGTVMLAYSFPGATSTVGSRSVRTQSDGTFQFKNVAGGTYMVMAGGGASQQVVASGADIDEVQLVVRRGSTVTGSVIAEDGTVPPFATSGVRVLLEAPLGNVLPTVRVVSVEADWSFTLEGLGGPFLFRLGGLPADWVLGSVRLGDEEITDQPWDVPTGGQQLRGLTLAVTQKVSKVSGDVLDAAGKPTADAVIVIFADEPGLWLPNSRFIQTARPGSDGKFSMSGLPAGAYRALALAVIEDGQAEDPEFLEQVRAGAVTFTLAEGGKETLALKLPKK